MSNKIQLLPDHIANQIAAGEVIQRPASVVKELMENAVDAKATSIHLNIKDAGKTLIQVIDNGSGMSETDSRLCFERHATSKIREAADLFKLSTNGFRGEALAAIAAIAHVELKTKKEEDDLGFHLIIEGSEVQNHEPINCSKGSNFSIKNLFYNVPARRNFLKTDKTEFRFISDEFIRLALAYPTISFSLTHNEKEIYNFPISTLRQRIVNLFGKKYNTRLAPLEEETDIVKFSGFICKPEFAKKTKKEQFFFVNNRFIKSHYLNHAIEAALENFIQPGLHPSYFIFIEVPPSSIDVNIHPTKTEIKFENEKILYSILRSCTRKTIGKYNIAPSIDFETNQDYDVTPLINNGIKAVHPSVTINPNFNPFEDDLNTNKPSFKAEKSFSSRIQEATRKPEEGQSPEDWKDFLEIESFANKEQVSKTEELFSKKETTNSSRPVFQLHKKYIVSPIKSGFVLIHQQRAHQRILFNQFKKTISEKNALSQQLLFPNTIKLSVQEIETFKEIKTDIESLGFDFGNIEDDSIEILGVPYDTNTSDLESLIEHLIEDHQETDTENPHERVLMSLAKNMCINTGKELHKEEMNHLIDSLYACEEFEFSPTGKKNIYQYSN